MRKLGDEASDRPEPREKDVASAGESARETLDRPVEKPLQKLIKKIVGNRAGNEVQGQGRQIGDNDAR